MHAIGIHETIIYIPDTDVFLVLYQKVLKLYNNQLGELEIFISEMVKSLEQFMCKIYGKKPSRVGSFISDVRYSFYYQHEGKVSCCMLFPCLNVF